MGSTPNIVTKKFREQVNSLIEQGVVANQQEVADRIKWHKTSMSLAMKLKKNIPLVVYRKFTSAYGFEEIKESIVNEPAPAYGPDHRDKLIASLERENARLQKDLDLSLGEVRHNILLSRATAEVTQNLVIEFLAKQRKMTWEELAVEVGKLNGERYQRIKEEGSFAYVGK